MKRTHVLGIIAILAAIVVSVAGATNSASTDQGRRLAGPFCVGKKHLTPVFVHGVKLTRAGVVRSIGIGETCQTTENRKFGIAVPDVDASGPTTTAGAQGPKGDTGAQGPAGATGPAGPAGSDEAAGGVWICADGNSGHGTAFGGTDPAGPVCNGGTKFAYFVEATQVKQFDNND